MRMVLARGLKVWIRSGTTDEKVVDEVINSNCYLKAGKTPVVPGEYWLDLGANIGTFSLVAAAAGARVDAYEPEPSNAEIAMRNVEANDFQDKVKIHQAAVNSSMEKQVPLYLCKNRYNNYRHTTQRVRGRKFINVDSVTLQELLGARPDGIKMDIEGSEFKIFEDVHDWGSVKKLVFEYHFDLAPVMSRFWCYIALLGRHFDHIDYGKIPADMERYEFYPQARIVHCWRD